MKSRAANPFSTTISYRGSICLYARKFTLRDKVPSSGRAPEYLLVAGVYFIVFITGWLLAKADFEASQSASPDSIRLTTRATTAPYAAPDDRNTGRLAVFSTDGCRYAKFNNRQPGAFEITAVDCDSLSQSLEATGANGGQSKSRVEAIGKYFRQRP